MTLAQSGSFTSGGTSISTPAGATSIDATVTAITAVAHTSAAATGFNTGTTCGYSDWAVGVAKNMVGKTCFGTTWTLATSYNVYKISGTALTMGDTSGSNDGSTAAKRPTTYESSSYTKQ